VTCVPNSSAGTARSARPDAKVAEIAMSIWTTSGGTVQTKIANSSKRGGQAHAVFNWTRQWWWWVVVAVVVAAGLRAAVEVSGMGVAGRESDW